MRVCSSQPLCTAWSHAHAVAVLTCAVIVESTYGVSKHVPREEREERFCSRVQQVLARGGRLLLPCVALGRAQVGATLLTLTLLRTQPQVLAGCAGSGQVLLTGLARSRTTMHNLNAGCLQYCQAILQQTLLSAAFSGRATAWFSRRAGAGKCNCDSQALAHSCAWQVCLVPMVV